MKEVQDSKSREEKFCVRDNSEDCKVKQILKTVKNTCDACPDKVFCEVAYQISGCNGKNQSDK